MNPAADVEQIIPPNLLRPTDEAQVAAAQQAPAGQPVLPAGLPQHGQAVGPQGPIPQGLIRPGEAQALTEHAALQPSTAAAAPVPAPTQAAGGPIQPIPDLPLEQAGDQAMALEKRALQSSAAAGAAQGEAANDRTTHLAQIDMTELRDQNRILNTHQALREINEAKASMDTHQWMTKIDDAIRKEPDPGRMFAGEGGGMRRFMWFAAILGNAIANRRHPERANVAMQMLMHEVDADVKLQQNQQEKELQGAKLHLQETQAESATARADLADDRSQKLLRIGTVSRVLRDQAMLPGPLDQKAAKLAAAAALDQQMAKEAADHLKESRDTRNKALDREKDLQLAGIRERAAMQRTQYEQGQQNYRQKQQQTFEVGPEKEAFNAREEGRKFVNAALLAPVEAQAKAAGAEKAGEAPLNTDLGLVSLDRKTGAQAPLMLAKEDRVKAGEAVHNGNKLWAAYTDLDRALSDISTTDFVAGNPKFEAARAKLEAFVAKDLHGGGRVSESFVKIANTASTGMANGWQGRTVQELRDQLPAIREVVKAGIQQIPQEVADEVRPYTRNNEDVRWTPQDLKGQAAPTPTARDIKASMGVLPSDENNRPTSVKEFDEIEQGKRSTPPMSPAGQQAVKDAVQTFGFSGDVQAGKFLPEDIESLAKAAEDKIRREGRFNDYGAGNQPIPEAEREDVVHMVKLAKERALNGINDHLHAVFEESLKKPGHITSLYNFDDFLSEAEKTGGFNTSDPDTRASLRRKYDSFHRGDTVDMDEVNRILRETDKQYK
jgi:hypothetical protein